MRSIQDTDSHAKIAKSGIFWKIVATFFGFSFLLFLLTVVLGYSSLSFLPRELYIPTVRVFTIAMLVFAAICILLHLFVTRQALSPLRTIVNWASSTHSPSEISVPEGVSPEVKAIFQILNLMVTRIKTAQDHLVEAEKMAAIGQTTQMLAHDVRRPFSLLKMGIAMLQTASNPESVKKTLDRLLPAVNDAVANVDGLISDVMEVGSKSSDFDRETAEPSTLVERALKDVLRLYPKSDINFIYDWQHSHCVSVNLQKISRVFANILSNALQSMGFVGTIWFKTRENGDCVEFCIGNSGSHIPEDYIGKLFDAFFTHGKKGGTGLGLAIAQKIVVGHGGTIWCHSQKSDEFPDGKVEFFFTLPLADKTASLSTGSLPRRSQEVEAIEVVGETVIQESVTRKASLERLAQQVVQVSLDRGRQHRVLLIDDEPLYLSAIESYLRVSPELSSAVSIEKCDAPEMVLSNHSQETFDLIISDIDLGAHPINGFDLVREVRKLGCRALICVHSNRVVASDSQEALAAGADVFVPKPMGAEQLLRLLLKSGDLAATRRRDALI